MTTENLEGSNCQVVDVIFRILWRRLLQAPCWELNQLQKKKWTEKWRKWAWISVQTLMFSMKVMNLAEAFRTCWDESLQIMECSRTIVCVCLHVWTSTGWCFASKAVVEVFSTSDGPWGLRQSSISLCHFCGSIQTWGQAVPARKNDHKSVDDSQRSAVQIMNHVTVNNITLKLEKITYNFKIIKSNY